MQPISSGQRRKIFALQKERGLDSDTLKSYIHTLTAKNSIRDLTIKDAIKVIDSLEGRKQNALHMISEKQKSYIRGLAIQVGFTDFNDNLDQRKLNKWLEKKYNAASIDWLTSKQASNAIEGLKIMLTRKQLSEVI